MNSASANGNTETISREDHATDLTVDRPWITVVWDDPVNLMSYVAHIFMIFFGYSKVKATELMMKVHLEGKAVVSVGTREEMERDVAGLHSYGLWATLQREDFN